MLFKVLQVNIFKCQTLSNSLHSSALKIDQQIRAVTKFSARDVLDFAKISGDTNPLHCDESFVDEMFSKKSLVVHGSILNGFVAGLIGKNHHGSLLYKQELVFVKPLFVNEEVCVNIKVESIKRKFVFCSLLCTVDESVVMKGNVVLKQK